MKHAITNALMNFSPIQDQQIIQKARNLAIEMDEPLIIYRGDFFLKKKKILPYVAVPWIIWNLDLINQLV
jgi:hypothetical protein